VTKLRCYMSWLTFDGLPSFPQGALQAIREAGYQGVQLIAPLSLELASEARSLSLGICGSGRVNQSADAARLAAEAKANGLECLTLHVGWGIEDDEAAYRLIEAVLEARSRYGVPLYVETHRATIFQDMWRTVGFAHRFPDLEFNGDFSHWYTGSEMVYGGFDRKRLFIEPVLQRVRFLHGRIGDPGCMQVDVGEGNIATHPYVEHFRQLWTDAFAGCMRAAVPYVCFVPELLSSSIYYARTVDGHERSDRWKQSAVLCRVAKECFAEATRQDPPAEIRSEPVVSRNKL
jgi:sugar phosphate isomerase/epimerase